MASPTCLVDDTATINGVNVTAGATVEIKLADTADARIWSLTCINTDELLVAATVTAGLTIDSITKVATFTAPAIGSALIFRSRVNNGRDANNRADPSLTTTFGIFVLTGEGYRVCAFDEKLESSAAFGWISKLNPLIRAIDLFTTPSVDPDPDTLLKRGAAGQGYLTYLAPATDDVGSVGFIRTTDATQVVIAALNVPALSHDSGNWLLGGSASQLVTVQSSIGYQLADAAGDAVIEIEHGVQMRVRLPSIAMGYAETPFLEQETNGSPGVGDGATWTWRAQTGRSQTGGAANNNGGNLELLPGPAGTGGGGASGDYGNLAFGAAGSYGNGHRVYYFANSTAAPTANPSNGVIVYPDHGILRVRSQYGVETTLAPVGSNDASIKRLDEDFVCFTTTNAAVTVAATVLFPSRGRGTLRVAIMAHAVAGETSNYFDRVARAHRPGSGVVVVDDLRTPIADKDPSGLVGGIDVVDNGADGVDIKVTGLALTTFTWGVHWELELYAT